MRKCGLLFASFILLTSLIIPPTSCAKDRYFYPKSDADMFKVVVKITNTAEDSGGTGVILRSTPSGTLLLTNKHVCSLFEGGGVVEAPDHLKHSVIAFKLDLDHDLCLVKIGADLGVNAKIALQVPRLGDEAVVAGHPSLLPTVITRGHFSEHMILTIADGMVECTDEQKQDPSTQFNCMMYGGLPILVTREGQLVSALILPGSSGSPVFNKKGEIAGMVFAGNGQLSFGIVVPLEFIRSFLHDQQTMEWTRVNQ